MHLPSSPNVAFATPLPASRRARSRAFLSPCMYHQHHVFRNPSSPLWYKSRLHTTSPNCSPAFTVLSVHASPVSGDSDGEVQDQLPPQKSYSVGVTIVSGCDARLRRNVIEKILADCRAGRVVVVTTGGITSTEEPDGQVIADIAPPEPDDNDVASTPYESVNASAVLSDEKLNGFAAVPSSSDGSTHFSSMPNLEGWIACSSPDEMAEVVAKLATSRECDYVIAEGSVDGSMEPQDLARLLHSRGGAALRVDTLVSVIDGDTLLQDLSALPAPEGHADAPSDNVEADTTKARAPEAHSMQDTTDTRPMMLVSLVENANVIVVSQSAEVAQSDQLSRAHSLVSVLNGSACILSATDGAVPVDQLVNTNAYDQESVALGATWKRVLIASRNAGKTVPPKSGLPKGLKDATFVYRARRPFHPTRLYEHIKAVATFAGVVRSMGRIWLATRMLAPLEWNQAGVAATLRVGKLFWAAVPESEWPAEEQEREKIMRNWDTQYGDRETEIVFVGMGIDKDRLQGLLDGCLLQDEEMVFTNMWENFEDPFVEWVPLIEDDEEASADDDTIVQADVRSPITPSPVSQPMVEGDQGETALSDTVGQANLDSASESVEGEIDDSQLPDEVLDEVSALDIFEKGFSPDSSTLTLQREDDGSYDEDQAVIASWDGDVADDILTQMPKSGLPVTIITGFLGSGKTTLLNYILSSDHGLRIAALVNEFGEIDIDNQLVERGGWSSKDEVLELANGCICCSINDSFVAAVSKILERQDQVDYLVVETTGVADPVPVINSLMVSDIAEEVRVDGIVTLVDAENFNAETQMNSEAARSQILAADVILLSKTDVAKPEKVEEVVNYVRSVRPAARILRSQRGRVPLNMILDVGVRVTDSPAYMNPVKRRWTKEDLRNHSHDHETSHSEGHDHSAEHGHERDVQSHEHDHDDEHDHECGPDCTQESHSHDHDHRNHLAVDGFVTTSFKSDTPLDPDLFMNEFLRRLPEGVFRAKGLLRFYGYGQRYVFQLSGRRYQFEEGDWPDGVAPGNQLVIIGRDLDLEQLRKTLESCLVQGNDSG